MAKGKKSFKDQYKSPKWQKKRLEILERDEFSCRECGSEEDTLHVHHYLYHKNKMLWEYDNIYLTTYCDPCHNYWHEINDSIKEYLCVDICRLSEINDILELIHNRNPYDLVQTRKVIEEMYKMLLYERT